MKRSRLSRGLQMQYLDLVVQLVLAVPVSVVSAIVIVAVPEAATTVETLAESMTALVGAAISLFGLVMLWRFHRNYRLALILQVVGWLVSMVELAALPLPILIVLGIVSSVASILYYVWLISATNFFLRQAGNEKIAKRGKWVLITMALSLLWAAALPLLPVEAMDGWWGAGGYIASWQTQNFIAGVTVVLFIVPTTMFLCYVIPASGALKYWPPETETLPPEAAAQKAP